jgi:hypothetical protein
MLVTARGRLYGGHKGVICRPSRIGLILMMAARGRMPATKGRVLMIVRGRFYDDRVEVICLMSDREKAACLQECIGLLILMAVTKRLRAYKRVGLFILMLATKEPRAYKNVGLFILMSATKGPHVGDRERPFVLWPKWGH